MSRKSENFSRSKIEDFLSSQDLDLLSRAAKVRRNVHGRAITFYLPGMIKLGRQRGRYPAVSITGNYCGLQCEHCKGKLLEPMIQAGDPDSLVEMCKKLANHGIQGVLLSGGSDGNGALPWSRFYTAIESVKQATGLYISAHVGFPDYSTCRHLKEAGLDQALIDVMGDEKTATGVYHLKGLSQIFDSLEAIHRSGLEMAPHVVAGLDHGKMGGEFRALEILKPYRPPVLVFVALTPLKGTPMERVRPSAPIEIARLMAQARLLFPHTRISLGCERPRNRDGWILERLAVRAGANRMAVWSEEAIAEAHHAGLLPRFQYTCCSVPFLHKDAEVPRPK